MDSRVQQLEAELEALRGELQTALEKQRAGDEVFRRFSESGLIGIALFNLRGTLAFANPALLKMIGYDAEDVAAGKLRWDQLTPPEWQDRHREAIDALSSQGSCAPYEREYLRADGSRFWGLFTSTRMGEDAAVAFLLDVTERKEVEEERLRLLAREQEARARAEEAKRRLSFLAEASRILASSMDYQTTLDRVAHLVVPILADGCDVWLLDEMGGIRRVAVTHCDPDKAALAYELDQRYPANLTDPRGVARVIRTGQPEIYREISDEMLVARARDEEHLRLLRVLGFKSVLVMPLAARGRTLGALTLIYSESDRRYTDEEIGLAEDLTRRAGTAIDNARLYREAQSAARLHQAMEQKLTLLTEATGALIGSLSLGRVLAEILALSRRLIAADAFAIWQLDHQSGRWGIAAAEGLSEQYQSAAMETHQHSTRAPNEPMVVSNITQEPRLAGHRALLEREGVQSMLVMPLARYAEVAGTLVFYYHQRHQFDDIELKVSSALANLAASAIATTELYEAASQRADQLAEADRLKDQFLAMLAHELRNPLNAICNAVEVTRRSAWGTPAYQRAQAVIERQSNHMAGLVNKLLDMSRIAHGRIELHPQQLDLARLASETAENHRTLLEAAEITLVVDLPDGPVWVEGDPTRLQQMLGNLLQNAAEFTHRGGRVTVRLAADTGDAMARLTVTDTGIGIAPEMMPRLFQPFVQADRSLDRARGGLGLGLALVKGIAELHGGQVIASSEGIGHGTTFAVEIPLQLGPPGAERLPNPLGGSANKRRVLIIEDNTDAAETLRDLLELFGHRVEVAYSGPTGVEMARQARPDVVLCDLGLPGMDGYAVAAALRRDPATTASRLIAVTGYGQAEDLRRTAEAGFDAHLTKPVEAELLQQVLE